MANVLPTCPPPFLRIFEFSNLIILKSCNIAYITNRDKLDYRFILYRQSVPHLSFSSLHKWCISAVSKKKPKPFDMEGKNSTETIDKRTKGASRRSKKKVVADNAERTFVEVVISADDERTSLEPSSKKSAKITRKDRKKATPLPNSEEKNEKKPTRRRSSKKIKAMDASAKEHNIPEEHMGTKISNSEEMELQLGEDDGVDISYTYGWPPLVCCFGAAQYAFLPAGRPANRLIDHEIHESMKDMFWSPSKFFRAPGGPSSSVALALAALGGRVAFMGKLGDDEYGQNMLYFLNINDVQTRSVKLDSSKCTAISHMKISRRGGLKMSCTKPCAEDSLLSSDINVDVLKEAKMFYFNSSSFLDPSMTSTTIQAIKASKEFGGVIFFDPNFSLPLWKSSEETKALIQEAWMSADIIELTKQELEFLCGIEPFEKFDTKDNDRSKFIHHNPEVVMQLWHENLKVLFVTNGTSIIHYYTVDHNGSVHGMEDPPITPFTGDMSASCDAIVAALLRMLTVQPHLLTDKGYLEHSIKFAINCGVIDQWLLARTLGFPPKEGMDLPENEDDRFRSIIEREYRTVEEFVS